MTTNKEYSQVREAVGVFGDADAMQCAIDDLLSSGFDRAELSLLGIVNLRRVGHDFSAIGGRAYATEPTPAISRQAFIVSERSER